MGDGVYRERERAVGGTRQSECIHTFHCSAEQKIITDGAPSSRDFLTAAKDRQGRRRVASESRVGRRGGGGQRGTAVKGQQPNPTYAS